MLLGGRCVTFSSALYQCLTSRVVNGMVSSSIVVTCTTALFRAPVTLIT